MDPARIQADTMGFADRFVSVMTAVYDGLEQRASTPAAKDAAHQLKTDLALGAIGNAVNPRPVAGMIDLMVYVSLLHRIAEDPWAAQTFGPNGVKLLVESLKRQEADVRAVASRYLSDAQLAELDGLVAEWHGRHPTDHAVSHFHLADLPEANRTPTKRGAIGASVFSLLFFDPTAHLDPTVREIELSRATSERMFFYLQRLPLLIQLQVEGFYRQLLQVPELRHAASDLATLTVNTSRFTDAGTRFTDAVVRFPVQVAEERRQTIAQVTSEVTKQRDAAITQATARIADERDHAIQETALAVRQEQRAFVANLEGAADRTINRLLMRATAWCLALVILISLVMLALRIVSVRRRGTRRRGLAGSAAKLSSGNGAGPVLTERARREDLYEGNV